MLKHGVCKISASRSVSLVITYIRSQRFTPREHYSEVIMGVVASQITGVSIVYSTVWSGADQRKYQSSASLAFVRGIHRWPVNSLHKGPVTRKCFHLMTSSWGQARVIDIWLVRRTPIWSLPGGLHSGVPWTLLGPIFKKIFMSS